MVTGSTPARSKPATTRGAARPDRQHAILLAAEKLFAQHGYHGVTIRQIAEENRASLGDELQAQAGRRYDARVVKACVKLLRERESRAEGEKSVGQRIA